MTCVPAAPCAVASPATSYTVSRCARASRIKGLLLRIHIDRDPAALEQSQPEFRVRTSTCYSNGNFILSQRLEFFSQLIESLSNNK